MAITIPTDLGGPGRMLGIGLSHTKPRRSRVARMSQRRRRDLAAASSGQAEQVGRGAMPVSGPASPTGVIGGAIIRAARRSAHLTRPSLARLLNVSTATVRAWENGTIPLFCVPYGQLQQLADTLKLADAQVGQNLGELLSASQCDLLLAGILRGFEDYAEVPPIDEHSTDAEATRELLRWALAGVPPDRYRQYASLRPLLDEVDIDLLIATARDLLMGSHGHDLVGYGNALIVLADH
jgi:transcriptional regulator with XRE-family HTH domain